jgi:amino acid transporter
VPVAKTAVGVQPSGSPLKRLLVGRAITSSRLEHTLLPKTLALPVFSSDALSSVAYASEEILRVLLIASAAAASMVFGVSLAISALMAIVVLSYRQTIRAYPSGGGAYIVSKENLGTLPGLTAASALLVDYMLTVVVSTVAGVVAIYSAIPALEPWKIELSVGFVVLITIANLRGVKEAGTIFAVPTYCFVLSVVALIVVGLGKCVGGCPVSTLPEGIEPAHELAKVVQPISFYVLLKSFSSGATALTGVEAISNGVPAFRRPQAHNAATTLAIMGVIAISMFSGLSWLVSHVPGVTISEERSVVAQLGSAIFGEGSAAFYVLQAFTAAILVLAANTAFQDFPRLASILSRDSFMPSQFRNRGDRLVFSNGVIGLAVGAIVVIVAFKADLTALIHLYVVGVFTSFTLSQSGMVRHWWHERNREQAARGWRVSMVVNAIGAITTFVVLLVVVRTKFLDGAWLSILVMAALVPVFLSIHKHYVLVRRQLRLGTVRAGELGTDHMVLLVRELDAATAEALGYVRSSRPQELLVVAPAAAPADLEVRWRAFAGATAPDLQRLGPGDLLSSIRAFVHRIPRDPGDPVTVILPEVIGPSLIGYLLRSRELFRLKSRLLREPDVVVTDVPVVQTEQGPVGVDARPLVPRRTVTLVFIAAVNDPTIRAVNYARSLGAAETRAIYFDLDPDEAHRLEDAWFDAGLEIPLDIVEAPFRDLTAPMLTEVRRFTAQPETVVNVVIPEIVVPKRRHLLLHSQNALFIKRLFLFEERVALTAVPFLLGAGRDDVGVGARH